MTMEAITYRWAAAGRDYLLELVHVEGTGGTSYTFGPCTGGRPVDVPGFFIATVPVTQSLWSHVIGAETNPALHRGMDLPLENVSWDAISSPGGFLDRINKGAVHSHKNHSGAISHSRFRRRPSGNMLLAAVFTGATAFHSAAVTISKLSSGMTAGTAITRNQSA